MASAAAGVAAVAAVYWQLGAGPPPTDHKSVGGANVGGASVGGGANLVGDPLPWGDVVWTEFERPNGIAMDARTELRGVVSIGPRLVAFGRGPTPVRNPAGLNETSWTWTSDDARGWHGVPLVEGFDQASVSEVNQMAAGPRGIVAAGGVCCVEERPAIWWSAEGGSWQRSDFVAGAVLDIVAGQDGFVAVGASDGRSNIWGSEDGLRWFEVDPTAAGLGPGQISGVAAVPGGYVAVGADDPGANADGAVWTSPTVADWTHAANDSAFATADEESLSMVVPFPGGRFAVGGRGTQAERRQCEQLLVGGLVAGGIETALSCGWLREMTWTSTDRGPWHPVDPWGVDRTYPPERVGPADAAIISWRLIQSGGPGLVLLDYEFLGQDESGSIQGLWTSRDGTAWSRVGVGRHLGEGQTVVDFVVRGRSVVAVGDAFGGMNGDGPVVWIGEIKP